MTLLGYRNPLRRVSNAIRGVLRRRPSAESRSLAVSVIGHRGAPWYAPENTIASFAKAADLGADAIEADICATRDGRFVLWHDSRPDDKSAIFRYLGEQKYPYEPESPGVGSQWRLPVKELDLDVFLAHHGYVPRENGGHKGARVPAALLEGLFAWLPQEPRVRLVCLDVKLDETETATGRALAGFVADSQRSGRLPPGVAVALLCPQREILQAMLTESRREPLGPGIRVFADFELPGALDFAKRFGADCVSFGLGRRLWPDLRHELAQVLAAREAGRIESVIVWTVNEEERLRELVRLRVDGILTDDPTLLRRIVEQE